MNTRDRIKAAQEVWDSVVADSSIPPLTADQISELERRDAEMDANPDTSMTWEQIKASVRESK